MTSRSLRPACVCISPVFIFPLYLPLIPCLHHTLTGLWSALHVGHWSLPSPQGRMSESQTFFSGCCISQMPYCRMVQGSSSFPMRRCLTSFWGLGSLPFSACIEPHRLIYVDRELKGIGEYRKRMCSYEEVYGTTPPHRLLHNSPPLKPPRISKGGVWIKGLFAPTGPFKWEAIMHSVYLELIHFQNRSQNFMDFSGIVLERKVRNPPHDSPKSGRL